MRPIRSERGGHPPASSHLLHACASMQKVATGWRMTTRSLRIGRIPSFENLSFVIQYLSLLADLGILTNRIEPTCSSTHGAHDLLSPPPAEISRANLCSSRVFCSLRTAKAAGQESSISTTSPKSPSAKRHWELPRTIE